jgi:2-aminoadipate transaminase
LVKQSTDLHSDQLSQAAMAEFLRRGYLVRHISRMKTVYRGRLEAMEHALERRMPHGVTWTRAEGGMTLWVTLPPGFDAGELLIHARERGIIFLPGRYFYAQHTQPNTLRLAFASVGELLRQELRKRQRGAHDEYHARVALI